MRHLATPGMGAAAWISRILPGSAMRAIPPCARMSAGTRSSAMTATAPASSAIFAWSAVVTSMMTPPLSISASPVLSLGVPLVSIVLSSRPVVRSALLCGARAPDASDERHRFARRGCGPPARRRELPLEDRAERADPTFDLGWTRRRECQAQTGRPSAVELERLPARDVYAGLLRVRVKCRGVRALGQANPEE